MISKSTAVGAAGNAEVQSEILIGSAVCGLGRHLLLNSIWWRSVGIAQLHQLQAGNDGEAFEGLSPSIR